LRNDTPVRLPIDHYHLLRGALFGHLQRSDPAFATFLHDEGYSAEPGTAQRYKLFAFSSLRGPKGNRRFVGARMDLAPGLVTWTISSPKEDFLRHEVMGILEKNGPVIIGGQRFTVVALDGLPDPAFTETMHFTCLTPIVAAVRSETHATPRYLRPTEGAALSEAARVNLVRKYRALHGTEPGNAALTLTLSKSYLARAPNGGTKKVTLPGNGTTIDVIGTLAPLTLTGSTELIQVAYECGLGEKNSSGMGMVEVDTSA
jgi:CRISPR-associated endoribonuclease Cas6